MGLKKARLAKDVWYVDEEVPIGCITNKEEIDKYVFKIGSKGDELDYEPKYKEWHGAGGCYTEDSEWVEVYE